MAQESRQPNDEHQDSDTFPVSSSAHRLLRRLRTAEDDRPPGSPDEPSSSDAPSQHVSPFTVEDLNSVDLQDVEPQATVSSASDPEEALRRIEANMARVTEELAEGAINQAQFQAMYTHYAEQKAVIQRLLRVAPGSDAWRRAAVEGHTDFLRKQHGANLQSLAIFDNWTSALVNAFGQFNLPADVLTPLFESLSEMPVTAAPPQAHCTQIEGGRWLCYVRGTFTTSVSVFSAEPSHLQLSGQASVHHDFEQINRRALEVGGFEPAALLYPQSALFGPT